MKLILSSVINQFQYISLIEISVSCKASNTSVLVTAEELSILVCILFLVKLKSLQYLLIFSSCHSWRAYSTCLFLVFVIAEELIVLVSNFVIIIYFCTGFYIVELLNGKGIRIFFIINKRGPAEKHFGVFSLETIFLIENLTQRWTQSGSFFLKSEHCIQFPKRAGKASPLPLVAPLWVYMNMHQYPWIYLNVLENAWINCSDYARALNMHDHLTCSTGFCRCLKLIIGFWIWHSCICKGYAEFQICVIMSPYTPIMPE